MAVTLPHVPEISRASPAYEQIAEHYRSAIRSNLHAPGDQMPSARALRDGWRVTLKVAHRALALLRDEGWIESRPGRPAIVKGIPESTDPSPDDGHGQR